MVQMLLKLPLTIKFKKNSEVLVPVNTWISTAEAVIKNNLKVKFHDIDEKLI